MDQEVVVVGPEEVAEAEEADAADPEEVVVDQEVVVVGPEEVAEAEEADAADAVEEEDIRIYKKQKKRIESSLFTLHEHLFFCI